MFADYVRQGVYCLLVMMMMATLAVSAWSKSICAQAERGYMPAGTPADIERAGR